MSCKTNGDKKSQEFYCSSTCIQLRISKDRLESHKFRHLFDCGTIAIASNLFKIPYCNVQLICIFQCLIILKHLGKMTLSFSSYAMILNLHIAGFLLMFQ